LPAWRAGPAGRLTPDPSPGKRAWRPGSGAGRRWLGWKGNRESVLDDVLGFLNGFAVPFSRELSVLSDKIGTHDDPGWRSGGGGQGGAGGGARSRGTPGVVFL